MKKITAQEVEKRAKNINPKISLEYTTYVNTRTLCKWFDNGIEFWRIPETVLYKKMAFASTTSNERRKKTNLDKYGKEFQNQRFEIKEQIKKINLERYGNEIPARIESFKKKTKETNLEKYGVDHPAKNKKFVEKTQNTHLERHGVKHALQRPEIKTKFEQTCIENHGVLNPSQNPNIQHKKYLTQEANGTLHKSGPELELLEFVKSLGFNAHTSNVKNEKRNYNLDILIPEKKLAIEFNGLYWHSEANIKMTPTYHWEKTKICKEKGIELIHIWEHEWENKKDIVKSYISSRLGINTSKIGARKCEIVELDKKTANTLLKQWHLLGSSPSSHKHLGLVYGGEIVSIVSYGKHHRTNESYVLSRFASKPYTNVVGALSKLTNKIIHLINADLISWVELRLSSEKSYVASGWIIEEILKPDYFYYNIKTHTIVSKQSRRKDVAKTPEHMTEHEHALSEGLRRIYDCGKIRLRRLSQKL